MSRCTSRQLPWPTSSVRSTRQPTTGHLPRPGPRYLTDSSVFNARCRRRTRCLRRVVALRDHPVTLGPIDDLGWGPVRARPSTAAHVMSLSGDQRVERGRELCCRCASELSEVRVRDEIARVDDPDPRPALTVRFEDNVAR